MQAKCPHCRKSIEIIGAAGLLKDYGLNGNRLQYLRESRKFPDPWLSFGNRKIYLKADVDTFREEEAQENAGKTAEALQAILDTLPPEKREHVLNELRAGA